MTAVTEQPPTIDTLDDLVRRLGNIPLSRIRFRPPPGTATEVDVIHADAHENRLCELVDGVLVEKAMGYRESALALLIGGLLRGFVVPRNLGLVTGECGMMRLFAGLVRIPDVAYASWDRVPGRVMPTEPIPNLVPDLAIEVLSRSNTSGEMARKCSEYFAAGVRMVWLIDPDTRRVAVYMAPDQFTMLAGDQSLDGGEVLPGLILPLPDLFAELDRHGMK